MSVHQETAAQKKAARSRRRHTHQEERMTNRYDDEKFGSAVRDYLRGRINRRQFVVRGAQFGLSAAVLAKLTEPTRAAANLIPSDPASPFESPITPERVAFLKTKPYKGTTINVMVLKATVGDGVKYHVPHWEEATGGKVNVAEVPIETLQLRSFQTSRAALASTTPT
jgi:multiple sugar transport system substrate-binding protein